MARLSAPQSLSSVHHLERFDCSQANLNDWLIRRALKNEGSASRTFVVCDENQHVVGYYCLSAGQVEHQYSTGSIRRNMPDPIPVMVLGRLAVDRQWQNNGVGKGLLKDAVLRTIQVSQDIGVRALLVHALSDEAKKFYSRCGFHESPTNQMTLMISLTEALSAL